METMIKKWHNQKEIPTPKTEDGKLSKNWQSGSYTKGKYCKPSEQLFPNRRPLSYPNLTKYVYEKVHKMKTAQKANTNIKQLEPQQKYPVGTIGIIKSPVSLTGA